MTRYLRLTRVGLFFLFFGMVGFCGVVKGQQLSIHNFENTLAASSVNPNITVSNVSLSLGTFSYQPGTDNGGTTIGFSSTWSQSTTFSTSGKYMQFTVSANPGQQISFSSLSFRFGRTAAGPDRVNIQYSTNGFATAGIPILTNGVVSSTVTSSLNEFIINGGLPTNFTGTLTIRIWGYNASSTGNFRFNNFRVNGTVTSTTTENTITTGTINPTTTYNLANCEATANGTVGFSFEGETSSNYNVQMSDAVGSFASPVVIGSATTTANPGTINFTIPAGTATGSGYKLRVVDNVDNITGSESANFTINQSGTCSSSPTDYFRSRQNGNWNLSSTWESSADNVNWINATITPNSSANTITISTGHTVNITAAVTIDQTVIDTGGTLNWTGGTLTIADGPGDDLIIFGRFRHNTGSDPPYTGGSSIRIKGGGFLEVNNNSPGASHYGTSSNLFYETDAVFYWNVNLSFVSTNAIFFPNSNNSTIPIFRVNASIPVGAGTPTTVNGRFEVQSGTVTWSNAGIKTFRNGIGGNGIITQASGCGVFRINGGTSQIGGGPLNLHTNGLSIENSTICILTSNKVINEVAGGKVTVANLVTFNAQAFALSGSANFTLNNTGTFITSHVNGISGSAGALTGGFTPQTGFQQTYIFNRAGVQSTGETMPAIAGRVEVINGSKLTLTQDLNIANLNGGKFLVQDAGSELRAASTVNLTLTTPRIFELADGGTTHISCLEYLRIITSGASGVANFIGNGSPVRCFDFFANHSSNSGVIFNTGTSLLCTNDFTLSMATGIFNANDNTLEIGGNWSNTNQARFTEGTSLVIMNGDAPQTFTCPGGEVFENLEIDNPTGVTYEHNVTIDASMTFSGGILSPSTAEPEPLFIFNSAATSSGASNQSFVNGPVQKIGNTAFVFPVGDIKGDTLPLYQPVHIFNFSGTATIQAQYIAEDVRLTYPATYNSDIGGCDHWVVNRVAGTGTAQVGLQFTNPNPGYCNDVGDPATLRFSRHNGFEWDEIPSSAANSEVISDQRIGPPVTGSGFGPYVLNSGSNLNILPISLLSFTAQAISDNLVETRWATASETNNDYFTVERSVNGFDFENVGFVTGAGNSISTLHYAYADDAPYSGVSYYRLRQTDFDGTFTFSNVVAVQIGEAGDFALDFVYRSETGVELGYRAHSPYLTAEIFDLTGRRLFGDILENVDGKAILYPNLSRGVYLIRLSQGREQVTGKFFY